MIIVALFLVDDLLTFFGVEVVAVVVELSSTLSVIDLIGIIGAIVLTKELEIVGKEGIPILDFSFSLTLVLTSYFIFFVLNL
jgi:hypothetical protein